MINAEPPQDEYVAQEDEEDYNPENKKILDVDTKAKALHRRASFCDGEIVPV